MSNLAAALHYREGFNFSVIPVRKNKKAYESWERYQKERADSAQIKAWWKKYPDANVGIVTGKLSGVSVVDVDTDEGYKAIQEFIPNDLKTPREKTPKGGEHIYFASPEKELPNNARAIDGCDFRGEGGYVVAAPSVSVNGGRYIWKPDYKIGEVDFAPLPRAYSTYVFNNAFSLYRGVTNANNTMFSHGRRDNDLFHVANVLVKGGMPDAEIFQVLENLIKSWGETPDQKWIQAKVESAFKRAITREKSLMGEVREWLSVTSGDFSVTLLGQDVTCVTASQKANLRKVLQRFTEEGVIERNPKKAGWYRIVAKDCEDIDYRNASTESFDICWPFNIERYVRTAPKNIIVIAGSPNSGKTAFLLNVVANNMTRHEIYYFSSEMGAQEMKDRLSKFDFPQEDWRFKPKERASNFADVIRPDAINIIDFLEVHEDFYKMGLFIRDIYEKLNKGIAIIAIQKNRGRDQGLGGERTEEKARLYLAMEHNKIKIVKGKNWTNPEINPQGLEREFNLVKGCKFMPTTEWRYTE